jgi:hypothetical protein
MSDVKSKRVTENGNVPKMKGAKGLAHIHTLTVGYQTDAPLEL